MAAKEYQQQRLTNYSEEDFGTADVSKFVKTTARQRMTMNDIAEEQWTGGSWSRQLDNKDLT